MDQPGSSYPYAISSYPLRLLNGAPLPPIGMGTFGSDHAAPDAVSDAVAHALRTGYRLIDCAAVYRNEAQIGAVLQQAYHASVARREDIFLVSKVWNDRHQDVLAACQQSLRDLRTDVLDLYLVHWPFPNTHRPGCDGDARNPDSRPFLIEEFVACWRQMEDLVDRGLVRYIGVSNMTIPKMDAFLPRCRILPAAMEGEMHPAFQQKELFDYARERNILPIGYCPLGSPNRPARDRTPEDTDPLEMKAVRDIAGRHGIHPALVCLKWAVQRGHLPIPFSTTPRNIEANFLCCAPTAMETSPLTPDDMALLASSDAGCRLIKGQVFLWEGAPGWRDLWDEDGVIAGWK